MNDTQITEYRDMMLRQSRNEFLVGFLLMVVMFGGIVLLAFYK